MQHCAILNTKRSLGYFPGHIVSHVATYRNRPDIPLARILAHL